jgi:predicted PurR-regulated permease PerM
VERYFKLRRSLAAALIFSLTLVVVAGLVAAVGATVWGQWPLLSQELFKALAEMGRWLERPIIIVGFEFHPQTVLVNLSRAATNALATVPLGSIGVLNTVTDNLLWSTLVLVSLYYFLKDGPQLKPWLIGWLPAENQAEGRQLLNEIDLAWGIFLRMQLLIFLILAFLIGASSWLIIWLFRAGWLPLSPLGLIILFILVYTAIQQLDNLWLRPQLLGRSLRLHPGVVLVSLIAALVLSGLLGALMIVPLLATIKIIFKFLHAKWLGLSYWPEPALPAESDPQSENQSPKKDRVITT